MSLSRLRGFFDRRWERSAPKSPLGVDLPDLYDFKQMGMQQPRHIKVRICHIPRRHWVRRFSLQVLHSPNRILQGTISTLESLLNTFWSVRRDAIVGSVVTLGMMLATQYIIGQLNGPLQQFISFVRSAQDYGHGNHQGNEYDVKVRRTD